MIRRWMIEPDESGLVSEGKLVNELASCGVILDRMGGHLRVTTHRQRSEQVPGEAFTVGVMVEWIDRTDDPRPAPEQEIQPPRAAVAEEPAEQVPHPSALMADEDDGAQADAARAAYDADAGEDGIVRDGDGNPVEDMTSVPAGHR